MPSQEERERLEPPAGSSVLVIRRTVWGPAGRVLKVNDIIADAGSYVLRYQWASAQAEIEPHTED